MVVEYMVYYRHVNLKTFSLAARPIASGCGALVVQKQTEVVEKRRVKNPEKQPCIT